MPILWNSSIVQMYSSRVLDKGPSCMMRFKKNYISTGENHTRKEITGQSLDVTARRRNGNSSFFTQFQTGKSCLWFFSWYRRTTVTRTLKGNEKQFKLARFRVIGIDCKIQFATLNLIDTNFSALRCIVKCKFAIGEKQRLHCIFCDLVLSLLQII